MSGREVDGGVVERRVGANVRRVRRDRGLSLGDLSGSLAGAGVEISTHGLGRLERGARRVTVDDLVALAEVFDVSATALLHSQRTTTVCADMETVSPELQAAIAEEVARQLARLGIAGEIA